MIFKSFKIYMWIRISYKYFVYNRFWIVFRFLKVLIKCFCLFFTIIFNIKYLLNLCVFFITHDTFFFKIFKLINIYCLRGVFLLIYFNLIAYCNWLRFMKIFFFKLVLAYFWLYILHTLSLFFFTDYLIKVLLLFNIFTCINIFGLKKFFVFILNLLKVFFWYIIIWRAYIFELFIKKN